MRGRQRYDRIARGTRRNATLLELGWMRWPSVAAMALLILMAVGVPLGMILYWLTQHNASSTTPVAVSVSGLIDATLSSIEFGLAAAIVTVVLALPLGFLASRHDGWLSTLLERVAYLAQGVPGIVVALALVALTSSIVSLVSCGGRRRLRQPHR